MGTANPEQATTATKVHKTHAQRKQSATWSDDVKLEMWAPWRSMHAP